MTPMIPEARGYATAVVFAKDQPQYKQLPANVCAGKVETKWALTWKERITLLLTGNMYLTVMTFDQQLQPIRMSVLRSEVL